MKIYIDLRFQFLKALRILFITIFKTHFEPGLTCDSFCLIRSHLSTIITEQGVDGSMGLLHHSKKLEQIFDVRFFNLVEC